MDDLDILTLAEAAARLGVAQSTLRNQVKAGRLRARIVGKTYITTGDEVERYRSEHLGRVGRPAADTSPHAAMGAAVVELPRAPQQSTPGAAVRELEQD